MNNITLKIKRLGPIVDTKISMAPFMIFTGSSNLGKSYVNFLTYYVMNFFSGYRIAGFLRNIISEDIAEERKISFEFTLDDLCEWMKLDVKLFFQYLLNYPNVPCDVSFEFESPIKYFNITVRKQGKIKGISESLASLITISINEHETIAFTTNNDIIADITAPLSRELGGMILGILRKDSFLLPPGRASLLNDSYSRQAETSKIGMYDIFLRDFDRINNMRNRFLPKYLRTEKNKMPDSIINGTISSTKDGLFLKLNDNTEIPLSAAASSIKELSPFILWMQTERFYNDSMCIEEPEAHAHPEMQYDIADLIASCVNKGAFIQMTTHSDYLLARLNQLIKLFDLKEKDAVLFNDICSKLGIDMALALDKSKIKAYYFSIDKESNGIKVEEQDVADGIPFSTFMGAVKMQMDWDNVYEENIDYGNL